MPYLAHLSLFDIGVAPGRRSLPLVQRSFLRMIFWLLLAL